MNVPKGYKMTEVGVIPEDWEVKTLSEMCIKIQDGTHFSPSLGGSDYLYLTSKNIGYGNLILDNIDTIDQSQHKKIYSRCDVKKGDVLLTKDGVNTGNAALNILDEEFSLLSSVAFLRFNPAKYDANHFLQQILSPDGQKRIKDLMSGNAITRLTLEKIHRIHFPVPPLPEQRSIARVLSDTDELINALDKLIAKKRDIKKAVMQELLTGKTRLPGFSGKWEVKKLGDLGIFLKGSGVKKNESLSGDLPCIRYGEIYTKYNYYIKEIYSYISHEVASTATKMEKNDILFAGSGETKEEIGKCVAFVHDLEAYAGGDIIILRPYKPYKIDSIFLGYYLNSAPISKQKASKGQGDAVVHISTKALSMIEVKIPSVDEQRSIAQVLSDMDREITALEQRRDKTKAIKQGMMQALLTGRIRLPKEDTNDA
jgi:type I restriction enzyme S subunit